jgi:hypothetical protein
MHACMPACVQFVLYDLCVTGGPLGPDTVSNTIGSASTRLTASIVPKVWFKDQCALENDSFIAVVLACV